MTVNNSVQHQIKLINSSSYINQDVELSMRIMEETQECKCRKMSDEEIDRYYGGKI